MAERIFEWTRVLKYVGTRDALDTAVNCRQVKGRSPAGWNLGMVAICEGFVGETPQPVSTTVLRELLRGQEVQMAGREFTSDDERKGYRRAIRDLLEELPL